MTESISDIALRLAREQLAAERADAPEVLIPVQTEPPRADLSPEGTRDESRVGKHSLSGEQTTSPDPPGPPLRRGGEDVRPASAFQSDDALHSARLPAADAGDRAVHQLVETVGEHGRRLEEVLSELERSLTTLFNTQLDAFRQLRDHAREQERRWVEQTTNRRTAYAPP